MREPVDHAKHHQFQTQTISPLTLLTPIFRYLSAAYITIVVSAIVFSSPVGAESQLHITFAEPGSAAENRVVFETELKDTVSSVADMIDEHFDLTSPLTIHFGDDDGPLFDGISTIYIPYSFLIEVSERFLQGGYEETGVSVITATQDALMHTLLHEFAHAIILAYDLPIVGKEEDAADGLATFLLIDFFNDGQEIAITAADLFDLESNDSDALNDAHFWSEHSLDAQRYYTTLCLIYGSAPQEYATLLTEAGMPIDRAEYCVSEYENTARSWYTLLEPHLLNPEESN